MKTNLTLAVIGWARGIGRALTRRAIYRLTHRRNWWLLKTMNDKDLERWASFDQKQREYVLTRRAWTHMHGRPVKTEPRSTGRSK